MDDLLPEDTVVDVEQTHDGQNRNLVVVANESGNGDVNNFNIPSPTASQ